MKKKPKAGQRLDGLWEAKGIDHSGRRKSFYGNTPEEASDRAYESFGIQSDDTLYGFYLHVYFPTVIHRSKNWRDQIAWAMDNYILPKFGRMNLTEITRPAVQRHFNSLTMKPKSISHVKKVFSAVMALAESDEIITRNPVSSVRIPPISAPEKTALTPQELWALYEASHTLIKPFVLLAGFAGLRLGEAVGMTWGHVSEVMSVRQQVLQSPRAIVTETLKTPMSRREIPYVFDLRVGQVSDVWICSDTKGGYILPKNVRRELLIACKKAGVPEVSPHELRHTFISIMENELECPMTILKELVGHAKDRVTGGYSHARMEQKTKWMQKYWDHVSTSTVVKSVVRRVK